MARGWESKSVEAQIEAAERKPSHAGPRLTAEQVQWERERDSLELSRKRLLHELAECQNARLGEMKRKALAHLDAKLAEVVARLQTSGVQSVP